MKDEWTIEEIIALKEEFDALGGQAWSKDALSYNGWYRRPEEDLTIQLGHYLYSSVPYLKEEGGFTTVRTLRNLVGNALSQALRRARKGKEIAEGKETL